MNELVYPISTRRRFSSNAYSRKKFSLIIKMALNHVTSTLFRQLNQFQSEVLFSKIEALAFLLIRAAVAPCGQKSFF